MKGIFTYIFSILLSSSLYSQVFTADDFITITSLSEKKVSSYISKKGFVQSARNYDDGTITNDFFYNSSNGKRKKSKEIPDSTIRYISGFAKGKNTGLVYRTSSFEEYDSLMKAFYAKGFISGKEGKDSVPFLQKEDITIHTEQSVQDEIKFYQLRINRNPVPTLSSVKFADDLLEFDSHEELSMLFGKDNVTKDVYYFSEKETNHCTVLYPNSSRQVFFVWEDQENYRKLSYILIGGSLRAEGSSDFNETMALDKWHTYGGLYVGMKLPEIIRYNNADFNFFGFNSEFALMAAPEKKGNIDFKKTGVVLGCFECSSAPLLKTDKVSAQEAFDEGIQLYILTIVLIPQYEAE